MTCGGARQQVSARTICDAPHAARVRPDFRPRDARPSARKNATTGNFRFRSSRVS
jgi:hypothetical protein